jgi:hypothetical protein
MVFKLLALTLLAANADAQALTFGNRASYCVTTNGGSTESTYYQLAMHKTLEECTDLVFKGGYQFMNFWSNDGRCRGLHSCPFEYDCTKRACSDNDQHVKTYSVSRNDDSSETCAGFWFDSSTESDKKQVYFYAEFEPVANGPDKCNNGLKGNASLGASTPPVPMAIQLAYHVKPGWMVDPGSADNALSGSYDYTGAAETCMGNGDACQSFSFECSNAPNGCGVCTNPRDQCPEKFPQEATQITYTNMGQSYLQKDANHAAYWKTGRKFPVSNLPSQKSNVISVMV